VVGLLALPGDGIGEFVDFGSSCKGTIGHFSIEPDLLALLGSCRNQNSSDVWHGGIEKLSPVYVFLGRIALSACRCAIGFGCHDLSLGTLNGPCSHCLQQPNPSTISSCETKELKGSHYFSQSTMRKTIRCCPLNPIKAVSTCYPPFCTNPVSLLQRNL